VTRPRDYPFGQFIAFCRRLTKKASESMRRNRRSRSSGKRTIFKEQERTKTMEISHSLCQYMVSHLTYANAGRSAQFEISRGFYNPEIELRPLFSYKY